MTVRLGNGDQSFSHPESAEHSTPGQEQTQKPRPNSASVPGSGVWTGGSES